MNECDRDPADKVLRKQFDGPISDEGFSERLMRRLPHRRRRTTWPLWAGMFAGVVACWLALWFSPLLQTGWHDAVRGVWSASVVILTLAVSGMAVLALIWGVTEGAEH